MKRTSVSTKATDLFGAGKHGFTDGVPSVTPATVLESTVMNSHQEEVARAIEGAGMSLNAAVYTQLSDALHGRRVQAALGPPPRTFGAGLGSHTFTAFATNGAGRIVGVAGTGIIGYSDDGGRTWTGAGAGGGFTDNLKHVIWVPRLSLFVAVGGGASAGSIQTSPDGATWTQRLSSAAGVTFVNVCDNGTVLAAQMFDTGGSTYDIYTSSNGIAWAFASVTTAFSTNPTGVCSGGGLFLKALAAAGSTQVYTSPDAITWTARTLGSAAAFRVDRVGYHANYGFVCAGTDGSAVHKFLQASPTGTTWTQIRTGLSLGGIVAGLVCTPHAVFVLSERNTAESWTAYYGTDSNAGGDFLAANEVAPFWALQPLAGASTWIALAPSSGVAGSVDIASWVD